MDVWCKIYRDKGDGQSPRMDGCDVQYPLLCPGMQTGNDDPGIPPASALVLQYDFLIPFFQNTFFGPAQGA